MTDNMQLLSFDCLARRILYGYEFCFADFAAVDSSEVSVESQKGFYDLCKSIVHGLYVDPTLLALSVDDPDAAFHSHECGNSRPDVTKRIKSITKALNAFYEVLYLSGLSGVFADGRLVVRLKENGIAVKAAHIKCLEHFGFVIKADKVTAEFSYPAQPDIIGAWMLFAKKCSANARSLHTFIHLAHDCDYTYLLRHIAPLIEVDDAFFDYITDKYLSSGYTPAPSDDIHCINFILKKDVGGINICFNPLWPTVRFVVFSCIGVKAILENIDDIDINITRLLVKYAHKCNDCMGCMKGGKSSKFTVTVTVDGEEYRLCPQFFQIEWYNKDISKEKIDYLLEFNELQEKYGKSWKKKK